MLSWLRHSRQAAAQSDAVAMLRSNVSKPARLSSTACGGVCDSMTRTMNSSSRSRYPTAIMQLLRRNAVQCSMVNPILMTTRASSTRHSTVSAAAVSVSVMQQSRQLQHGVVVEWRQQGCGAMLGSLHSRAAGGAWVALDQTGVKHTVTPNQVSFVLPQDGKFELNELLRAADAADRAAVACAWQQLTSTNAPHSRPQTLQQMCERMFGELTASTLYSAHRVLSEDKVYFKQVGKNPAVYRPRTAVEVEALAACERDEAALQRRRHRWTAAVDDAKRRHAADEKIDDSFWLQEDFEERLQAIEMFAAQSTKLTARQRELVLQSLTALQLLPSPEQAAELLRAIGRWGHHVNLALIRDGISSTFTKELVEAAGRLCESSVEDADEAHRIDLTSQHCFTIDDDETTEVDDAIAVEQLADGRTKLWIHVADPTRWLQPGHALDIEARKRSTTMYLPTGTIPMFPNTLGSGLFSLNVGSQCAALSFWAVLAEDGSVAEYGIEPTTIAPSVRLNYEQAALVIDQAADEQITALHAAAQLRQQWRVNEGAVDCNLMEFKIKVNNPHTEKPDIEAVAVDRDGSAARNMVAEMMILAGEIAATFGARHGLALPYRSQPTPQLPSEAEMAVYGSDNSRKYRLRRCMSRTTTLANAPTPHAGLGLPRYVQCTSPIRRYTDLLAHWQIKAALRASRHADHAALDAAVLPFTAQLLQQLIDSAAGATRERSKAERDIEQYWLAEYFSRQPSSLFHAELLGWLNPKAGRAIVLLLDVGVEALAEINHPARPGDILFVKLSDVNVRAGSFQFTGVQLASRKKQSAR